MKKMTTLAKQQKKIPKLRFAGFFGEWEEEKLGDIVKNVGGTALENFVSEDGNYKFISIGNYSTDGKYIDNGQKIVLNDKTKTKLLDKGDLVMVLNDKTASGDLIGSTILIDEDDKFIYNQRSERLICEDSFDSLFVWHFLNSPKFRKRIVTISQGGTQIYVNFPSVKKELLILPKKKEQQKIAEFLGVVDEWIENLRGQKGSLEKYKKGMMQKIFSQEARFKDDDGKKFLDWETKKLGEIFSAEKGSGLPKDVVIVDGKNECILYGELYTKYKEVVFGISSKTNSNDGLRSEVGDLLIPCSTTTTGIDLANITALNKKGVLLGGDITVLRSKENINNIFYAYYLSNYKKRKIASYAQGSTIVHLYYNHFKKMKIEIPTFKEQQKISEFLTSVDNLIESKQQQITQAKRWKKGLMQGLFV